MTASPNDGTAAADETRATPSAGSAPLPRRTQRTTAIAQAAASTSATPADWSEGRTVTERSRRAAEIPEEAADPSGESGSTFADGFAAGLAFAPRLAAGEAADAASAQVAGPADEVAQDARRRRSRRTVLVVAVLAAAVLACVPFAVRAVQGDSRGAASVAGSGGQAPAEAAAPVSPSASQSPSATTRPRQEPGSSASARDSGGVTPSPERSGGKPDGTAHQPASTASPTASATGAPVHDTVPDGAILNPASGRCIDNSTPNNTPVQLWDCTGSPQQTWRLKPDTSIRSVGRCLDVVGGSRDDGAGIQLADCNGTGAQQFRFDSAHRLVNIQAGKCVALAVTPGVNGTRLQLRTCNSSAGQRFTAH
ncbi:ricin-type beta-trefoil lectin domain protein [Streptomyces sp. NPDC088732]|uniref:ricin-type beta-trefoil lectin domain protein n=1 Tax=Streptomyces sp. NPDC088732 TaxID=3365879 RepID=UPI00381AE424